MKDPCFLSGLRPTSEPFHATLAAEIFFGRLTLDLPQGVHHRATLEFDGGLVEEHGVEPIFRSFRKHGLTKNNQRIPFQVDPESSSRLNEIQLENATQPGLFISFVSFHMWAQEADQDQLLRSQEQVPQAFQTQVKQRSFSPKLHLLLLPARPSSVSCEVNGQYLPKTSPTNLIFQIFQDQEGPSFMAESSHE
jgi:hypothetical protein